MNLTDDGWISLGFTVPDCNDDCGPQEVLCTNIHCRVNRKGHTHQQTAHTEPHRPGLVFTKDAS